MEKTRINLATAYVGECQARNRYTFYASTAKKEGYEQIGEIFALTAENEREHASWFLKMLRELQEKGNQKDQPVNINTQVNTIRGTTLENLKNAINGETHEFSQFYPEIADTAEKEGFTDIAKRVRAIAVSEEHHAKRYSELLKVVEEKSVFQKKEKVWWVCRECGYVYNNETAPDVCPSCGHKQSFYQLLSENY